ncbi:hypothetical protein BDZ89DRAFT_1156757 [Hymenopellis radicata]|nr:hypothetical protein BDZ89DRAFT_1156757 [Hymenopellis radicata]
MAHLARDSLLFTNNEHFHHIYHHLFFSSLFAMAIPPILRDTAPPPVIQNTTTSNSSAPPTTDAAGPTHKAGSTPQCRGGNSRTRWDDSEIGPLKYKRSDYEPFLQVDLRNSRVLVDIDKFSERVLRIPFPETRSDKFCTTDARLNKLVDAIYGDAQFKNFLQVFLARCRHFGSVETSLYALHADMNNRAMEMIEAEYPGLEPIRFYRNDPKVLMGGILNRKNLSPDMFGVFKALFDGSETNLTKEKVKEALDVFAEPVYSSIYWAMVLLLLEGKDGDCTLWDGRDGFRMLDPVTKKDPIHLSAPEPRPRRKPTSQSRPAYLEASTQSLGSTAPKRQGPIGQSLPAIREEAEDEEEPIELPVRRRRVPDDMAKAHNQCARYGFEALSVPALRDSFVMHLFDRNRVQVLYYSHSLMLTSTAIDLEKEEHVKRFIALLVSHHRLTMRERGVLPVLDQAESFLRTYQFFADRERTGHKVVDRRNTYCGITMTLPLPDGSRSIKVTLGPLIAQEPGIIGRSTCVFEATSEEWPGMKLAVKLSWPGEKRTSEAVFLEAAKKAAAGDAAPGERHWVLDHLPNLLLTHDFATEADSTEARIAQMLSGAEFAGDKAFSYEHRVLRITIHELLFPLETLTNVQDVAQVFADAIQCHGWLYKCPGILHRDISMSNIMYRIKADGRICGVLNDFDLSSFLQHLGDNAQSTSHQRTGTPPFMAMDLLVGEYEEVPKHLYRHDLESFFYVMIVFMSHYELCQPEPPKKKTKSSSPPPRAYIQPHLVSLRDAKAIFFTSAKDLIKENLSPSFQAIAPWLLKIRSMFGAGVNARATHARALEVWEMEKSTIQRNGSKRPSRFAVPSAQAGKRPEPFDNVTLGGAVSYNKFMGGAENLPFGQDMVFNFFADLP